MGQGRPGDGLAVFLGEVADEEWKVDVTEWSVYIPVMLQNTVAERRLARGLSITALADRIGISRQALSAIESGRSAPSTPVALRLARELGCSVEALFQLPAPRIDVEATPGTRVVLGRVADRWVAHALEPTSTESADGLVTDDGVEPLEDLERLERTALVAGCAPVLGALAGHLRGAARWLHRTSGQSLAALAEGRTHIAGLHLAALDDAATHERLVRAALPGEDLDIVGLVGWREGLAVAPGNPKGLQGVDDLVREGLIVGRRPEGSGAEQVLRAALERVGAGEVRGRPVASHVEAARAIAHGAVDAAVVIEPVAAAFGLPFFPLSEERFELVLRSRDRSHPGVRELLDRLTVSRFAREVRSMGAYDTAAMGELRRVRAA